MCVCLCMCVVYSAYYSLAFISKTCDFIHYFKYSPWIVSCLPHVVISLLDIVKPRSPGTASWLLPCTASVRTWSDVRSWRARTRLCVCDSMLDAYTNTTLVETGHFQVAPSCRRLMLQMAVLAWVQCLLVNQPISGSKLVCPSGFLTDDKDTLLLLSVNYCYGWQLCCSVIW